MKTKSKLEILHMGIAKYFAIPKSKLEILHLGIALGVGAIGAVMMLVQDLMGKEAYIVFIQNFWINLHPIVALLALVSFVWMYFYVRKRVR